MTQALAYEHLEFPPDLELGGLDPEVEISADVSALLDQALDRCRRNDWKAGLRDLVQVAENRRNLGQLPSLYFSYLGFAIAHQEHRVKEGLRYCRYALRREFFQPENYLNLARTCILAGRRREAWRAVERGLALDADQPELLALRGDLGARKPPIVGFLARSHPLNIMLGRIRQSLAGQAPHPKAARRHGPGEVQKAQTDHRGQATN